MLYPWSAFRASHKQRKVGFYVQSLDSLKMCDRNLHVRIGLFPFIVFVTPELNIIYNRIGKYAPTVAVVPEKEKPFYVYHRQICVHVSRRSHLLFVRLTRSSGLTAELTGLSHTKT